MNEQDYIKGRQSAFRLMLQMVASELEGEGLELAAAAAELIATRAALAELCKGLGLPEFDQKLWLPDVVEKHIGRNVIAE